jgi:hypothetical protein
MISVHEAEKLSLERIAAFLHASEEIRFLGENRQQVYAWVEQVLRQQLYVQQGRRARGLLRHYLAPLPFRLILRLEKTAGRTWIEPSVILSEARAHSG